MNLKVFLGLLKNHGMQIDTAMSGKECLARLEKNAYHIILTANAVSGAREMLQTFLDSPSAMELSRYYEESDFENYRIKIHAIKTNLAKIGAVIVSDMAKQLELALKNENNVSYVKENHDEFMAVYERVVSEVKTYIESANTL